MFFASEQPCCCCQVLACSWLSAPPFQNLKGIYILSWNSFSRLQETTSKTVEREIEDSCRRIAAQNSHIPPGATSRHGTFQLCQSLAQCSMGLAPEGRHAGYLKLQVLNAAQWLCFHKASMAITSSEQVQKSSTVNHR